MYFLRHLIASLSIYILCLAVFSDGARILASVATPSFSHQVAFRTLWKELAKRGHEIVLLTTDLMEGDIKNIRQIDMSSSYDIINRYNFSNMVVNVNNNILKFMTESITSMGETQRYQFQLPEVQELINNSTEHFDLFMTEVIFPIHLGFIERFKVPVIGLTSLDAHRNLHLFMGNDDHLLIHPMIGVVTSYPPSLVNTMVSTASKKQLGKFVLTSLLLCRFYSTQKLRTKNIFLCHIQLNGFFYYMNLNYHKPRLPETVFEFFYLYNYCWQIIRNEEIHQFDFFFG